MAASTGKQGAADHDDGDRVEFEAEAEARVAGARVEDQHESSRSGADAVERIDRHSRGAERQSHEQRGLLAVADREKVAAEAREVREQTAERERGDEAQRGGCERKFCAERNFKRRETVVEWMRQTDGLRCDPECATAHEEHAGERDKEWRLPEPVDCRAHAGAERGADPKRRECSQHRMNVMLFDQRRGEDRREPDDGADGQIDAARENHERHSDCSDAERGVVGEKIEDAAGGEKTGVEEARRRVEHGENRSRGKLRQPGLERGAHAGANRE